MWIMQDGTLAIKRRTRQSGQPLARGVRRRALALGLLIVVLGATLVGCGPDAHAAAQQNKTRLDNELHTARTTAGVPDGLLQPIETQEKALDAGTKGGSDNAYQLAADGYAKLYKQVVALENMTPNQARAQASGDLQTFTAALQQVQTAGFSEAKPFAQQLPQAQQRLDAAKTTKDYFAADDFILQQTTAVQQIIPVYHQMQALKKQVDAQSAALGSKPSVPHPLACAFEGVDTFFVPSPLVTVVDKPTITFDFQQWPTQDLAAFRAARNAQDFSDLAALVQAQSMQLSADAATLGPTQAATAVKQFQADVQTYTQDGGTDGTFAKQAAQDAQALDTASTISDYANVLKSVRKHEQGFQIPLMRAKAQIDLKTLQGLIDQGQASKTYDKYDGKYYPNAYEYADHNPFNANFQVGIQDAQGRLARAQTLDDYQTVDQELQMFITNISAMLTNLKDKTPSTQPHQTDLDLMSHYGILSGDNIVVSLREQKARVYSNGKLIKAMDVTTGSPDKPSPPGIHCVLNKRSPDLYKSPDPPTSPLYYKPTPVHFSMWYSQYGFYLHDGWWRDNTEMGYLTNLPHYDPEAFNGGSHGCVNFHYANGDMAWLYNFAQVGTPVIIY
jgi:hypothetical protein